MGGTAWSRGWPQVAAGLTGSVELYRVVDEVQTSVHGTQGAGAGLREVEMVPLRRTRH
jgi:hypothetical protein